MRGQALELDGGHESGLVARGLHLKLGGRPVLDGLDLAVAPGTSAAIMGPSGSGKTTLLHCLSGLLSTEAGTISLNGQQLSALSIGARADFRLRSVGTVFQFGELLPELSVRENVELPLRLSGGPVRQQATALLEAVGLRAASERSPAELSGGERQRVGIARALVADPSLVLADEPTGALDEDQSQEVCELMISSCLDRGAALVIATHDPLVADRTSAIHRLRHGTLQHR